MIRCEKDRVSQGGEDDFLKHRILELKPSIARPKIFWTKISAWDNDIFSLDCLDLDSTLASRVKI